MIKVIVNNESGNCDKLDVEALLRQFACDKSQVEYIHHKSNWRCDDADTVVVCGGDGTLKNALAKCQDKQLIFVPCGTLNESKNFGQISTLGKVNDQLFSYVCATGSFTEIGYETPNCKKKKWKVFAYFGQVLKYYKCHNISAKIQIDDKLLQGKFTLIMAIKGRQCFGFAFNKTQDAHDNLCLLAVKSFGKDNLWHRIQLFFTFFRIFFCGLHPTENKRFVFVPFENATIQLDTPCAFCLDGEKYQFGGKLLLQKSQVKPPIQVVNPPLAHKLQRRALRKRTPCHTKRKT